MNYYGSHTFLKNSRTFKNNIIVRKWLFHCLSFSGLVSGCFFCGFISPWDVDGCGFWVLHFKAVFNTNNFLKLSDKFERGKKNYVWNIFCLVDIFNLFFSQRVQRTKELEMINVVNDKVDYTTEKNGAVLRKYERNLHQQASIFLKSF